MRKPPLTPEAEREQDINARLDWPSLSEAATRSEAGEPHFPTSDEELEKLAPTRADRWRLLDALEGLEQMRPLTPAEIDTGLTLTAWLGDEIGLVCESLGELVHEALDRPDPSTWAAVSAFWHALTCADQIHFHQVLNQTVRFAFVYEFQDDPYEPGERVRRLREARARDLANARRLVDAERARARKGSRNA